MQALGLALAKALGTGPSPMLLVGVVLTALLHARSRSGGGD
jgi:hypothetical protein